MGNDDINKMMEDMQKQALAMQQEMMKNMADPDVLAQIQAGAAGFGGYDDDEDEMSEEELAQFISDHKVPDQYEKYMPMGAVLIGMNGEPYQVLAMTGDVEDWKEALEDGWGIDDRESALDKIEWLLDGGHADVYNEGFVKLQTGEKNSFDADDIEDYETCIEGLTEALELPKKLVKACRDLSAWDLERVGYLARIFAHVGYISEAEAWPYFERAGKAVGSKFASWEEYIISLIFGRSFPMGLSEGVFAMSLELLTEDRSFLDAHPIKAMA